MKKPDILPGKREISYSHGHAHITRDGEPFVNLQLGREGRGFHAEGVHFKLAPDARLIAAAPAVADILARILYAHESPPGASMGEAKLCPMFECLAREALIEAGYTTE